MRVRPRISSLLTIAATSEPLGQRETFAQERRGRLGRERRYRKKVTSVFRLETSINAETIAYDATTDGMFPIITDADELASATVLEFYRYQPNLERRHHMLKGTRWWARSTSSSTTGSGPCCHN